MSSEKALNSENLLKQSEDLGTTWSVFTDLSTPTGSQTSPSGDSTAWLLTADTDANASPSLNQSTSTGAGTHTMVAHLKSGTASHGFISVREGNGNIAYAMVDFSAGTSTHGSYGSVTNPSSTVTALGSDWYRLTLTATVSSGVTLAFVGISDGTAVGSSGYDTGWNSTGQTMYAWGIQLSSTNSKVYDSPTTTQISRSYSPLLKTASADAPRFEYAADGQSDAGSPRGLLIEASASNLLTYSEDFSNAAWTKLFSNVQSNVAIGPSGELSADNLIATSDVGEHRVGQNLSVVSGSTYTISVIAKSSGSRFLRLGSMIYSILAARASFDLETGTVATTSQGSASIEPVGNGFYRCSVTATAGSSGVTVATMNVMQADNTPSYTGDDYSGVLLFGAMAEQSSSMSSYIKSTSSSVTRAADSCSVALSDINFAGGEYSLVADASTITNSDVYVSASLYVSNSNYAALYANGQYGRTAVAVSDGVSSTVNGGSANGRIAVSGGTNSLTTSTNGGAVTTDTSYAVPDLSGGTLQIGTRNGSSSPLNGNVKRVALYSVALSDTELQAITS